MTYYNLVHHDGHRRFAGRLVAAGIDACILPDLPLEESGPWCAAADDAGVETVMLAAPTAPDERLPRVAARARGFIYSVGLLGVTGERAALAASATELAGAVEGDHRSSPCSSASGCRTPSRPARRAPSPTASCRARRSCAA